MSSADLVSQRPRTFASNNYTMGVEDGVAVTDSAQKVIERQLPSVTNIIDDLAARANTRDSIPKTEGLGVKMRTAMPIPSVVASLDKYYSKYGKRAKRV